MTILKNTAKTRPHSCAQAHSTTLASCLTLSLLFCSALTQAISVTECFIAATSHVETTYCEILKKGHTLPEFYDFQRNPEAIQRLLLKAPARKAGITLAQEPESESENKSASPHHKHPPSEAESADQPALSVPSAQESDISTDVNLEGSRSELMESPTDAKRESSTHADPELPSTHPDSEPSANPTPEPPADPPLTPSIDSPIEPSTNEERAPLTDKTHKRPLKDENELADCQLDKQEISCPRQRFFLVVNIPLHRLNTRVLEDDNTLEFPAQAEKQSDLKYLSAIYPRYIEKMLLIGLGDSTMSFTKFVALHEQAKQHPEGFGKRFGRMYELLKNERKTMAVKARYQANYPPSLAHCMPLSEELIACDDIKQNWVYRRLQNFL